MSSDRAAWDPIEGESSPAFHAFVHYRDLGETRSVEKAWLQHVDTCGARSATPTHYAPGRWLSWSVEKAWTVRVKAWDEHLDHEKQARMLRQHLEMADRQAKLGRVMQTKAAMYLAEATPENVTAATRLADVGAKLERQALGEPGLRVEHTGEVTHRYATMTDDELIREAEGILRDAAE